MTTPLTLTNLNQMSVAEFTRHLGGVFEHSPYIAELAAAGRPFATIAALHAAMVQVVESAGEAAQLRLIRAHPELAGKAAVRGELTHESTQEQSGAGLNACSPQEFERLMDLNSRYQQKFGFPFIVAVRGHTRHSIIALFEQRLNNSAADEMRECLNQIYRIGLLRLEGLLIGIGGGT